MVGKPDGTLAQIIEVARNECIFTAQIGSNVAAAVDAGALPCTTFGIVVNAVP